MPISSGATPAVANATKRAIGLRPRLSALSRDITSAAAAPSDVCDEVPAVTVPLAWNTGFSFAERFHRGVAPHAFVRVKGRFSDLISICRPACRVTVSSSRKTTVTGTISSLNLPASIAALPGGVNARQIILLFACDLVFARNVLRRQPHIQIGVRVAFDSVGWAKDRIRPSGAMTLIRRRHRSLPRRNRTLRARRQLRLPEARTSRTG